jgi:thioredoxin-related protein
MIKLAGCSQWHPNETIKNFRTALKMKSKTFTLIFLMVIGILTATAESQAASNDLKWYSFDEGMAIGSSEGKKIFIHFRADWCRYCYTMAQKTFRDAAVVAYLRKNFISILVDYDQEKRLVSMFKVKGVPDNWFFSKEGEVVRHQPGYIPPDLFLKLLKNI